MSCIIGMPEFGSESKPLVAEQESGEVEQFLIKGRTSLNQFAI
jgi:hypothetical protein